MIFWVHCEVERLHSVNVDLSTLPIMRTVTQRTRNHSQTSRLDRVLSLRFLQLISSRLWNSSYSPLYEIIMIPIAELQESLFVIGKTLPWMINMSDSNPFFGWGPRKSSLITLMGRLASRNRRGPKCVQLNWNSRFALVQTSMPNSLDCKYKKTRWVAGGRLRDGYYLARICFQSEGEIRIAT